MHTRRRTWLRGEAERRSVRTCVRAGPHILRRTWRHLGSHAHTRSISSGEFLRDLRRADRRADLHEEPVRLAWLSLAGGCVSGQTSQLGTLDVEEWLVALRARHLEPGVGLDECGFDLWLRLEAPDLAECAHAGEQ